MIKQIKELEGSVVFQRSEDDDGKCVCCEGKHIFSQGVRFKEDWKDVIQEMLDTTYHNKDNEGREVHMKVIVTLKDPLDAKSVSGDKS